jgi:hypothetical protein
MDFPGEHRTKSRSNSVIERGNREIRRRTADGILESPIQFFILSRCPASGKIATQSKGLIYRQWIKW